MTASGPRSTVARQRLFLWCAIPLLLAAIAGALVSQATQQRLSVIRSTQAESLRLTDILAAHVEGIFAAVEAVMAVVDSTLSTSAAPEPLAEAERLVDNAQRKLGIDFSVSLIDAQGQVLDWPKGFLSAPINVADREFFKIGGAKPAGQSHIGEPVLSRVTGKYLSPVTWRATPNGHGVNLIVAAIRLDSLQPLLRQLRPEPGGSVIILRRDGVLLIREPFDPSLLGRRFSGPLFNALETSDRGVFSDVVQTDGVHRTTGYRLARDGQLAVAAAFSTDQVLTQWRNTLWIYATIFAITGALILTATWEFDRSLRFQAEAAVEMAAARDAAIRANEATQQSAQRFYAMLSSLKSGILVVGPDGRAEFANQALCDLLGLEEAPEELVGMTSPAMIARVKPVYAHPESAVARIIQLVRDDTGTMGEEVEMRDGRVFLRDYVPIRIDGRSYGRLWQFVDITDRRKTEEALRRTQRMDAVGQLTGGIAHDFNNILMVVIGNLRMLAEDPKLPEWAATSIDLALKASQRGAELTAQLLAFSRQLHLSPQAIDLRNEAEIVTRMMRRTLPSSVTVEADVPDRPVVVRLDPGQLETALINLMLNARDAMPGGGHLTLKVEIVTLDEPSDGSPDLLPPGTYGSIRVADTGTGIPETVKAKVFEPFFTTKPQGQGTGLGLSMVHGFIRQSGGLLQLHSAESHGTQIDLFFPLVDSRPESTIDGERLEDPALPPDIHRILLVEDIDEVRATIQTMLVSLGFDVVTAGDSASALTLLEQDETLDLLLTDVGLPGAQDGRALAATAGRRWPRLRIVTMSGHDAVGAQGDDAAHWPHLKKPFRRRDLAAVLGRLPSPAASNTDVSRIDPRSSDHA